MFILRILQILFTLWFLYFFITQILVPGLKGQKLFPFFNKRRANALDELTTIKDDMEVEKIEHEINSLKLKTQNTKEEKE